MDNRWLQMDRLFEAALDHPAEDRRAFVEQACGGDRELCDGVMRLLTAEQESQGRFDSPGPASSRELISALAGCPPPDRQIGPYTIVRELGRGGMGTVYLARQESDDFQRDVALKVLRRGLDTEDVLRRFVRERRILASLNHPNIAKLYDGGTTPDGRPYLVMELVNGAPITRYADGRTLDTRARLQLIVEVADAVRAAHAALIVHRDLKPSNILVDDEGRVKLLDFGIAKLLNSSDEVGETRSGLRLLTPDHASPEQLRGEPVSTSTDVYQLGVLLFEVLTGTSPFVNSGTNASADPASRMVVRKPSAVVMSGSDAVENARARRTTPANLRRILAGDLDRIVAKALHESQVHRYASAEELARDLRRFLDGRTVSARPDTLAYSTRMALRRHRWVAPVSLAALAFLAVWLITLQRHADALEAERNAAKLEAERAQEVQRFLVELFGSADPETPASPEAGRSITVAEALDVGTAKLRTSLTERPEVRAAILAAISETYHALGQYDRALPLREEAHGLIVSMEGETSRAARDSLRALALIRGMLGTEGSSLDLHERRLALAGDATPADDAEVADARLMLGRHLVSLNRPKDAAAQFERIIASAGPAAAPTFELGAAFRGLADAQRMMEQYEDSVANARRAVTLVDAVSGAESLSAAFARGTLAQSLGVLGRTDEAERNFSEAIPRLEAALGPDHKHVRDTKSNLAVLRMTGNPAGAASLLRELVESGERIYGPAHPELGIILQNLGTALMKADLLEEARGVYERVAALNQASLPENDYRRALPLVSLSSIHLTKRRPADAERVAREALLMLNTALPPGHYITAVADCRLARALVAQGRDTEAASHFERATPPLLQTRSTPAYRLECLGAAAEFHEARGDAADAARLREAIASISG